MTGEKRKGSSKRFGARYGRTIRYRIDEIEAVQKGKQQCPYCHSDKIKRLSSGIWTCGRCESKFTGWAYSVRPLTVKEEKEEKKEEKPAEAKEEEEEAAEE